MNSIILSNDYFFREIKLHKYHHTDNRTMPHPHFFAILLKGKAKLVSKTETVELEEGDVFYIPMDCSYESFWFGDSLEWKSFGFTYFPEGEYKQFRMQKIDCSQELKKAVYDIPVSDNIDSAVLGKFYTVISELIPLMKLNNKCKNAVLFEKAIKKMYDNTDWDFPQIAEHCSVSESTLYAAFRKVSGKTPNQIRHEILTQKAVQMLSSTDKSVQEISDSLGFSSTSYFRKILFKITGNTPSQIRKNSDSDFHTPNL